MSETSLSNWAGNVRYKATGTASPGSVSDVEELVRAAGPGGVRGMGRGHSFSPVGDTRGVLVSLRELPWLCEPVKGDAGTVVGARIGPGLTFGEICPVVDAWGCALPVLGSLPHISLGGACATGTHGSGWGNACVGAQVDEVLMIAGNGCQRRVRRGDDSFDGVVVSLGALGLVVEMVMRVVDSFDVEQYVFEGLPFPVLVERLSEVLGAGYSVSVFWPLGPTADVWVKRRVPDEWWDLSGTGAAPAHEERHPVAGYPAANCTPQLGWPGRWFERLPHFRAGFAPATGDELQSEYLIPVEDGGRALEAVARIAPEISPLLLTVEVRSVAMDPCWLSPAYGRDSVAVHLTWVSDPVAVNAAVRSVEEALGPLAARPHWGKVFGMAPGTVAGLYPRWDDFRRLLDDYDPEGLFRNAMIDRIFPRG
ncbi:D-arabinono-1,4-lactone oxidase [Streptomyces sp. NPDC051776]|uniref:D-arabinono-1,4-lactone oxidase n=1 Tax=Streptomyces sp. NPDC051776 TaxID=3155414 RepID=UPI0034181706